MVRRVHGNGSRADAGGRTGSGSSRAGGAPCSGRPPGHRLDHRCRHQEHPDAEAGRQSQGRSRRHDYRHRGDIPVSDAKKGLTIGDVVNPVGQNKIAINFVWTLVTGFLVMFMQAGFAIVETGLCRAKNANHTMMMNFMVYGVGMLAYWLIGFAIQMGGVGAVANLGGTAPLNAEFAITPVRQDLRAVRHRTASSSTQARTYDVGVMVMFLFQMVFMDTALTIVTGTAAERWKFAAFLVSSFVMGAFTYPLFANWAWGGGWLATLGANFGLGQGYCGFRRLRRGARGRRPHGAGDGASSSGRASASSRATASRTRFRATTSCIVLTRLLHPGLRLVRIQPRLDAGRLGQRQPAHRLDRRQHDARRHGRRRSARCSTCGCATASRTRR